MPSAVAELALSMDMHLPNLAVELEAEEELTEEELTEEVVEDVAEELVSGPVVELAVMEHEEAEVGLQQSE
jgi:hypothetical protein